MASDLSRVRQPQTGTGTATTIMLTTGVVGTARPEKLSDILNFKSKGKVFEMQVGIWINFIYDKIE
jgi:hypothetical protein